MTDDDTARVRAYESDKDRINGLRQGDDTQADVIARLLDSFEAAREQLDADMAEIREEQEFTPLEDLEESDVERVAKRVAERLEGAKPLEDMAFDDWFEPDYTETIARHITAQLLEGELSVQLDRIEEAATTAEDRAGSIQNLLEGELR